MFEKAIAGKDLSDEEITNIKLSPAYLFMVDSLVEIIKNTMDEALLGHYENGLDPKLDLTLNIDIASSPENIILTLIDNGRGFSKDFLSKVSTPIKMTEYLAEVGSQKMKNKDGIAMPPLFGGAGKGLRILMALILEGKSFISAGLRTAKYQKPEVSTIHLDHAPSGGALIQIRTSKAPLQKITMMNRAGAGAPAGAPAGTPARAGAPARAAGTPAEAGTPAGAGAAEQASAPVLMMTKKRQLTIEGGDDGHAATSTGREAMARIRKRVKADANEGKNSIEGTPPEGKSPST